MTSWQPIETAPRDGTRVLMAGIYSRKREIVIGYWHRPANGEGFWISRMAGKQSPSHWMPLPPFPTSESP